jgi:hypothetical protein
MSTFAEIGLLVRRSLAQLQRLGYQAKLAPLSGCLMDGRKPIAEA